ncbi:hypothetical protein HZA87_06130 [Candidatus Uhrbacteria bacterium]|nr:hypothetical protein [Candidatus Uhrbacteria bacterium]
MSYILFQMNMNHTSFAQELEKSINRWLKGKNITIVSQSQSITHDGRLLLSIFYQNN